MFYVILFICLTFSYKADAMIRLPTSTMFDGDLLHYVHRLRIPNFRGVKMRDELPSKPRKNESGILNLNTHDQKGSHWVAWYKDGKERYYFDSFGEPPPIEIMQYLKSKRELEFDLPVIRRNAVTVQHDQSNECGALCLFILKYLSNGIPFSKILETLQERYKQNKSLPLVLSL